MDYQTQQAKLFTPLAMAFSFHFAGQTLWQSYNEVQEQMESGGNFERWDFSDQYEFPCFGTTLKGLCQKEHDNKN